MTSFAEISARCATERLGIAGGFHLEPADGFGAGTLMLLAPAEPGYWAHLLTSPEWQDGRPDPVDRWSRRVIGRMACALGGKAKFPFGGPPWHPFYRWALRSGQVWASPVSLLVGEDAGLFVSFRGALVLPYRVDLPAVPPQPCETCAQPCLSACPAGALSGAGYDVARCHDWLDRPEGQECLSQGCRVRRSCPVSAAHGRVPDHSAYHMSQFHR